MILIILILLFISGICNGVMDSIMHHDRWAGNAYWGKDAWKNKYLNHDPDQGPAFWGSTTFLAFICDGWHLCKEIMISSSLAAITLETKESTIIRIGYFILLRLAFYAGFKLTYK